VKKHLQNEKGLTLVEILAAIVILAIVLVSFSSFFLQSAKHTKYNNEKLTAVQIAEEVIADVRSEEYDKKIGDLIPDDTTTYHDYIVAIEIKEGPSDLGKAVITVTSKPAEAMKKSSFTTEMYFEVKP